MDNQELAHWGIKGMKWGVRRYQNKDGSLTDAGKKRYGRDAKEKGFTELDSKTNRYIKRGKKKDEYLDADPNRYVREDITRSKKVIDTGKTSVDDMQKMYNKIRKPPESKVKLDLSSMSDADMRAAINRKILEKQYKDMFNPPEVSRGQQLVDTIFSHGAGMLGVTSSALGVALAIKELRG